MNHWTGIELDGFHDYCHFELLKPIARRISRGIKGLGRNCSGLPYKEKQSRHLPDGACKQKHHYYDV